MSVVTKFLRVDRANENDAVYTELLEVRSGLRLRVRIRSNTYAMQCTATVEVWGRGWVMIDSLEPLAMSTPRGLIYKDFTTGHFQNDRETLLETALWVLGHEPL